MPTNDIVVRVANSLASLIQETKPKAKVFQRWILSLGLSQSAPYLLSEDDEWEVNGKWHHAYMIGMDAPWQRTHLGVGKFQDDIRLKLWGFYGFRDIAVLNQHNSEHVFIQHLVDVSDAISAATKFESGEFENGIDEIKGHDSWQIDEFGTYNFGKERLHVAQGGIVIHLNRHILPVSLT